MPRRFSLVLSCCLLCPVLVLSEIVHVSTTGSDDGDGSEGHPLRTFRAAQLMARILPATKAVQIQFAAGVYHLNETQVLTQDDSGSEGSPRTYCAAPGANVTLVGDQLVEGWRPVASGDAGYELLSKDARASVMVAPLPPAKRVPNLLFDAAAASASPKDRAVRALPNQNAVSSLVPEARTDSDQCKYLGQFKSELACRAAALAREGLWAYAWHDPAKIAGDFAGGCYGRRDVHGSRDFPEQEGVYSALFAPSVSWREVTDWEISSFVTTQHRCDGAECEDFDSEDSKSVMNTTLQGLERMAGNAASSLSLRIFLVDFAMNVLPVASIVGGSLTTAYPGTLRLGQRPGYCDQDFNENKCSPAIWILNTMNFSTPGQFAVNSEEGTVYYWPALVSKDVSRISMPTTSNLVSLRSSASAPVKHVSFVGLTFARANYEQQQRGDAGGIQHDWAALRSNNSLLTLSGVSNFTVSACTFRNSAGGGVRADGFAQNVVVTNNTFRDLGMEAVGFYGLGLGLTQVTSSNVVAFNDVSRVGLVKFDSPAIVIWEASFSAIVSNYIHDTSTRALYVGGSRYCTKPDGFATDGGIATNVYDEVRDGNVPADWLKKCADSSYAPAFADDCKCSFFRGAQGNVIRGNIFARVTQHKASTMLSDGLVYISGPGYEASANDVTVYEDNTYLASPGGGAPSFRMLYVDGYTGAMNISRNAVVDGNSYQGFNLCNWYGHSFAYANVLQMGDASWGGGFQISCDGNPDMGSVVVPRGNIVLSDETSPSHDPDADFISQYSQVHDNVCAASVRAGVNSSAFLTELNGVVEQIGGKSLVCSE